MRRTRWRRGKTKNGAKKEEQAKKAENKLHRLVSVSRTCIAAGGAQFSQRGLPTGFSSSFQTDADETLSFLPRRIVR